MTFSPLIRVVDKLLMMGLFNDKDLNDLLILIDPVSFDPSYHRGQYVMILKYCVPMWLLAISLPLW